MNWKKSLSAFALTSLLFTNHLPVDAASTSSAEKLVRSAESYAGSLKWATSVEGTGDGKTIPWNYFNGTKNAYSKALSAVSKIPNSKTKTSLLNRLENNVNLYISTTPGKVGRAVAYIDAINAGLKIENKKNQLNNRLAANIMDDVTEQYYHELSREIKKQAYLLDRVYGVTTRETIRNHFKGSAEKTRQNALYPVSILMALEQFQMDLDTHSYGGAIPFQTEIESLFQVSIEKELISQQVYDQLLSKYQDLQKRIPTLLDFTLTDIDGKLSITNNFNYEREFNILPNWLNGFDTFSFRLYEEAAKVSLKFYTDNISEVVFTGENILTGEIDLNDFKTKHQITDLKDLTFELTVIDKKGKTILETGKLIGHTPFVFTNGKYVSESGYTIDIPRDYELRKSVNKSEHISTTDEETGGNWLSVEKLNPDSDLTKVRQESIEFLKSAPGQPKDYDGLNEFTNPDTELKMHLLVRNNHLTEEIVVLKIDGQLMKFTFHVEGTQFYPEVRGAFTSMIKSISFN